MHVQITLYASKSTSTLALENICFAAVGTAGNYFPTKLTVSTVSAAPISLAPGLSSCHTPTKVGASTLLHCMLSPQ